MKKKEEPLAPILQEPEKVQEVKEPEEPVNENKILETLQSQTSKFGVAMEETLSEIMYGAKEGKK